MYYTLLALLPPLFSPASAYSATVYVVSWEKIGSIRLLLSRQHCHHHPKKILTQWLSVCTCTLCKRNARLKRIGLIIFISFLIPIFILFVPFFLHAAFEARPRCCSAAHMLFMVVAHKLSSGQARNVDDPHLLPFNTAIFRPCPVRVVSFHRLQKFLFCDAMNFG